MIQVPTIAGILTTFHLQVPMEQMGLTDLPGPSGPSQRLITVNDTASKLVDTVEATSKLVPTGEITSDLAEADRPSDPEPAVEDMTLFKPKPISKSRRRAAESSDESYHPDMDDAEPEVRFLFRGSSGFFSEGLLLKCKAIYS